MKFTDKIDELAAALAAFQAEVKNPANTATNPFLKNKYAPLSEVLNAVRPIAAKHGLSIIQEPIVDNGSVSVTTYIFHSSGQFIVSTPVTIPLGGKGTAQEIGAAITYGRRYAISALFGVSSEDDDDANSISTQSTPQQLQRQPNGNKPDVISEAQRKRMFAIANGNETLLKSILANYGYEHSKDVSRDDYDKICNEVAAAVNKLNGDE